MYWLKLYLEIFKNKNQISQENNFLTHGYIEQNTFVQVIFSIKYLNITNIYSKIYINSMIINIYITKIIYYNCLEQIYGNIMETIHNIYEMYRMKENMKFY